MDIDYEINMKQRDPNNSKYIHIHVIIDDNFIDLSLFRTLMKNLAVFHEVTKIKDGHGDTCEISIESRGSIRQLRFFLISNNIYQKNENSDSKNDENYLCILFRNLDPCLQNIQTRTNKIIGQNEHFSTLFDGLIILYSGEPLARDNENLNGFKNTLNFFEYKTTKSKYIIFTNLGCLFTHINNTEKIFKFFSPNEGKTSS
jgi:hypothetical protein